MAWERHKKLRNKVWRKRFIDLWDLEIRDFGRKVFLKNTTLHCCLVQFSGNTILLEELRVKVGFI